ncbi:FecCD family ABC transporter permease [Frankia tisae]|uniref:FecCD family ABC transporter permease n=1 Tax=Frankia tisae TaxID=2950104 RepID=UPI0021BED79A|nr:iron ABC transporter permease [Frankia tisae]
MRRVSVRVARPEFSRQISTRSVTVLLVVLAATTVAIILTTAYGDYSVPLNRTVEAILGNGDPIDTLVIRDHRLPRVLMCVLVGAALALSGGVFQTLTRNPLAAPDIIGVTQGAAVVAVWMILRGLPEAVLPVGAFAGAMAALAVVAVLGVRRDLSMYRLILIGIGLNTLIGAAVTYLIARANAVERERLNLAEQWLVGSTSATTWPKVGIAAGTLALLTPAILSCGRSLNTLQLGDDLGAALGVPIRRLQLTTVSLAALLAAVAVSVTGPIGFVAFVSPHIARRLTGTAGVASLPTAMGVGGLLLLIADYAAQRVLEPSQLPVGYVTIVLGAPYLLYLLVRGESRMGT